MDADVPDLTVSHQLAAGVRSEADEPLPPEAANHQVVVGDIPAEPPGFRPRAGLLAKLDRTGARVSVIHAMTGLQGLGASQLAAAYARAKLAAGWRLVAWVNAADAGSVLAGLAAVAEATGLIDADSGQGIADAAARRCGTCWRPTGPAAYWCSMMWQTLRYCQPFIPANGTAQVVIVRTRRSAAEPGECRPG